MDGTLAKFYELENCCELYKNPGFFKKLKREDSLVAALTKIQKTEKIAILSSVPSKTAIIEKLEWLEEVCPELSPFFLLFPFLGENKAEYVKKFLRRDITDKDILLDDYSLNLNEWEKAGGTGIKWYNGLNMRGWNNHNFTGTVLSFEDTPEYIAETLVSI